MSWLRGELKKLKIDPAADPPDHVALRLAGHSSGGCFALLCAVELKKRKWKMDGVVTFGSFRVGKQGFKTLYQSLELQHCTVQFANRGDIVPCMPPENSCFEHVVENHELGSSGVASGPAANHQIAGSEKSYQHTLRAAVDGREGQSVATKVMSFAAKHGPAVVSKAAGAMGVGALVGSSAASLSFVELQKLKQELQAEIVLMMQRQSQELAALATCLFKEIDQLLRWNQTWGWLVEMKSWLKMFERYNFEKWKEHAPDWFTQYRVCVDRVLEAARRELANSSEMAPQCVKMYLRAADCLVRAMIRSGAPSKFVVEEVADSVVAARELFPQCHYFDPQLQNEVMQLLPSSFARPEVPILKLEDDNSLNLDLQIESEADLNSLLHDPQYLSNVTALSLDFRPWKGITDASLQGLVHRLPCRLTSINFDLSDCQGITDTSLRQLADELPGGLVCLELNLSKCRCISQAWLPQLSSKLQQLQHLKCVDLFFSGCEISDTARQDLEQHLLHLPTWSLVG
eukprot:Skav205952  [mRNA]  locus=scaffold442:122939:124483:+ [translate_table: standard]